MHDFDEGLTWGQALRHLNADRARFDRVRETLHYGQRHVGVKQGEADFAHRVGNIVVGESAASGKGLQRGGQTGSEPVKHIAVIIRASLSERYPLRLS